MKIDLRGQFEEIQKRLKSIMEDSFVYCKSSDRELCVKAANINNNAYEASKLTRRALKTFENEMNLKASKNKK